MRPINKSMTGGHYCVPPETMEIESWTQAIGQQPYYRLSQLPKDHPKTKLWRITAPSMVLIHYKALPSNCGSISHNKT